MTKRRFAEAGGILATGLLVQPVSVWQVVAIGLLWTCLGALFDHAAPQK
jgi:hypothetical protein